MPEKTAEPVYEVYAIRFATNPGRLRGQDFIADATPLAPHVMDFFCWVIVRGGQAIMVDTGSAQAVIEQHGLQFTRCPTEALAALGIAADQVRTVILTHLHYDHIGNLDRFPVARFYVQAAELQFATGPNMQHHFLRRPYGAKEMADVIERLYAGRIDVHGPQLEIAPGVLVHLVGGHTAGQEIVRVRTPRGWMVLASDALHYYEELERGVPFAVAHDIGRMLAAHATIRSLADSDAHIIPAHDPLVLRRYPAAAPGLEGLAVRLSVPPEGMAG